MAAFIVIWIGQLVSILASGMAGFGLSLWMYSQTESATAMGLMHVCYITPFLIMSPLAGVMVDRYNRKLMMILSDLVAGLGTVAILILHLTGNLEVWHFYMVNAVIGLGNAFQWPAYSAAISTMVPKEQYGRANGMMSLVQAGPNVVAPILAGALLPFIGLNGILLFDISTFILAIGAILMVVIPKPVRSADGEAAKGNLLQEATFGFKYIFQRAPLLGYVILLFFANLFLGLPNSVHVPMILLRSGNDSLILGTVQTAGAISWTVGSLIMSAWGGPKRRIHGALLGWVGYCLFGNIIFGLGKGLPVWIPSILVAGIGSNIGIATSQAILQSKVAPDVQGRVFSARRLLTWLPDTFTPVLGGLLADKWVEPGMNTTSWLSRTFGWMVGISPGSGMALIMVISGVLTSLTLLTGYLNPKIRNIESLLPDHKQPTQEEAAQVSE